MFIIRAMIQIMFISWLMETLKSHEPREASPMAREYSMTKKLATTSAHASIMSESRVGPPVPRTETSH